MVKVISKEQAEAILSKYLVGCSINLVTNNITGWILRLIGPEAPAEYSIQATDIVIPKIELWRTAFQQLPVNLLDTNEPDDVITASIIYSVLNRWPVQKVTVDDQTNLILSFENEVELILKAQAKYVDWTWQVDHEDGSNIILWDSSTLNLNDENIS